MGGRALGVPFMRVLILFIRVPPSGSNHPKGLTSSTIKLGVRISTCEFWRDINIQFITDFLVMQEQRSQCADVPCIPTPAPA